MEKISFEDACKLSSKIISGYILSVRAEGRQLDEAVMEVGNQKLREALAEVGWTISELADEARKVAGVKIRGT